MRWAEKGALEAPSQAIQSRSGTPTLRRAAQRDTGGSDWESALLREHAVRGRNGGTRGKPLKLSRPLGYDFRVSNSENKGGHGERFNYGNYSSKKIKKQEILCLFMEIEIFTLICF